MKQGIERLARGLVRGLAVAAVVALAACASRDALQVREVGSFHLGGQGVTLAGLPAREVVFSPGAPAQRIDPNGDFEVGQMYVRYTRLAAPKARYPLLMWHGGGLTGVTWETRPDGQPGWESWFLRAGHDVYLSDAVERGRASWARFPEIYKGEPFFRTKKEAWELFRIGAVDTYATSAASRRPFADGQFPVEAFDQFMKQGVARWAINDGPTQAAYDAYVQKVCPCVLFVHSQSGNFGFTAALNAPDRIKAIVALEPGGSPEPTAANIARLKGVPILFVWGDHLQEFPFWARVTERQERFRQALVDAGGTADALWLAQAGFRGNSHMIMMDRNADAVAARVQQWLADRGLMR